MSDTPVYDAVVRDKKVDPDTIRKRPRWTPPPPPRKPRKGKGKR